MAQIPRDVGNSFTILKDDQQPKARFSHTDLHQYTSTISFFFFEHVFIALGGHVYVRRRDRTRILKSAMMWTGNSESLSLTNIVHIFPLLTQRSKITALTRSAPGCR